MEEYWVVALGDVINLATDSVETCMTQIPKVGDKVNITRKPRMTEPFNDIWDPICDQYIGSQGKVIDIIFDNDPNHPTPQDIALIDVETSDGNVYSYPFYCLSKLAPSITTPQQTCNCKLELLLTRGCRCGAFNREQVKKK